MTREQLQRLYPDTYIFFREMADEHPFWVALSKVRVEQVQAGRTLLADLEQVFAALREVDGHHVFIDRISVVTSHDELMQLLTKLYVAYLYRDHGAELVHGGEHGFDIEVTIADQLLALGVVSFHSFDSLTDQFARVIHDEIVHLKDRADIHARAELTDDELPVRDAETVSQERAQKAQTPEEFIDELERYSKTLKDHTGAHHQIVTSVSPSAILPKQAALSNYIDKSHDDLAKRFPMIAGVLLVDPRPGVEKASFLPFHVGGEYLQELLDKTE
jgi:hypothetical protein